MTWHEMGNDAKARHEAATANDLAAGLSLETRLRIEGPYRKLNEEWVKAIQIYQLLWKYFPDETDYALQLAAAQTESGKGKDALETIAELRRQSADAMEDPRVDYQE